MTDILLTTIWHTGTHSLSESLKGTARVSLGHCNPSAVKQAKSGNYRVITTYRDPLRVAASWRNRDRFIKYPDIWMEQWACWGEIVPHAEIVKTDDLKQRLGAYEDKYNLHRYLDDDEMGLYFAYVPKDLTDYAFSIVDSVKQFL